MIPTYSVPVLWRHKHKPHHSVKTNGSTSSVAITINVTSLSERGTVVLNGWEKGVRRWEWMAAEDRLYAPRSILLSRVRFGTAECRVTGADHERLKQQKCCRTIAAISCWQLDRQAPNKRKSSLAPCSDKARFTYSAPTASSTPWLLVIFPTFYRTFLAGHHNFPCER